MRNCLDDEEFYEDAASFGYPGIAMTTQSAEDAGLQCGVDETIDSFMWYCYGNGNCYNNAELLRRGGIAKDAESLG